MKLKEIKPGMVIHYKNDGEKKLLLEELERLGYVWYGSNTLPTKRVKDSALGAVIHVYDEGYKHITHSTQGENVTHEFSDLILPEIMTEEEAYKKGREDAFEEVKNCEAYGYDCGLKDAWELARKLAKCSPKELDEMYFSSLTHALVEHTYHKALAKVEAYEKEKEIKVGDVVERDRMGIHIVTHINVGEDTYTLINNEGRATVARRRQIYKTGKNYGVVETILAEIGKE